MSKHIACLVFLVGCGSVYNDPGAGIDWTQSSASLTASSLRLVVDGVTFHGSTDHLAIKDEVYGDEIDVTWAEGGHMPRVHLDFMKQDTVWWISSVRARRLDDSDWIEETGRYDTTTLGQPYEGGLDFVLYDSGHHAELHLTDVRLATFGSP